MKYVQSQKMYHFNSSQIVTTLFGDPLYATLGGNEVWIQGRRKVSNIGEAPI